MTAFYSPRASTIECTEPVNYCGQSACTELEAAAGFDPATSLFKLSPSATSEKRNWNFEKFKIKCTGIPLNAFMIDLSAPGKHLNKLSIKNVISDAVTQFFVQLYNPFNMDGLFCGEFSDNWSMNGYYMDNIGDSFCFHRNITTGAGRGYYINQVPGASHIMITDGNCTSAGGVLFARCMNLFYERMQTECSVPYTGSGTGLVTVQNGEGFQCPNVQIRGCNINTHGTTNPSLHSIFINDTYNAVIENNSLFCHSTSSHHIVIGPNSKYTKIGKNDYYNQSGNRISPRISNSGIGTQY